MAVAEKRERKPKRKWEQVQREVSSEEVAAAMRDPDIQGVIRSILKEYSLSLDSDQLENCGTDALWRAMRYYNPAYRQKFTTSLHTFVHWHCCGAMRKKRLPTQQLRKDPPAEESDGTGEYVRECVARLPESSRRVVERHYLEGATFEEIARENGYSAETARQKVLRGVKILRAMMTRDRTFEGGLG